MSAIKCVSRRRDWRRHVPASAFTAETPRFRYKMCLTEQTTLGGKKGCLSDYIHELADEKNP